MGNIAVNPCDSGPCQNGGTCTATNDGYTCQCTDEFTGDQCEQCKCGYIALNCHYKYSNSFSFPQINNMAVTRNRFFIHSAEESFQSISSLLHQCTACLEAHDNDQAEVLLQKVERYEETLHVMDQLNFLPSILWFTICKSFRADILCELCDTRFPLLPIQTLFFATCLRPRQCDDKAWNRSVLRMPLNKRFSMLRHYRFISLTPFKIR